MNGIYTTHSPQNFNSHTAHETSTRAVQIVSPFPAPLRRSKHGRSWSRRLDKITAPPRFATRIATVIPSTTTSTSLDLTLNFPSPTKRHTPIPVSPDTQNAFLSSTGLLADPSPPFSVTVGRRAHATVRRHALTLGPSGRVLSRQSRRQSKGDPVPVHPPSVVKPIDRPPPRHDARELNLLQVGAIINVFSVNEQRPVVFRVDEGERQRTAFLG